MSAPRRVLFPFSKTKTRLAMEAPPPHAWARGEARARSMGLKSATNRLKALLPLLMLSVLVVPVGLRAQPETSPSALTAPLATPEPSPLPPASPVPTPAIFPSASPVPLEETTEALKEAADRLHNFVAPLPPSTRLEVDRSTPRRTLEGYLLAIRGGHKAQAARYLDLKGLPPEERSVEGPRLAARLYAVIERTRWIVPEDVPDEASIPSGSNLPVLEFNRGGVRATVSLQRVGSSWYFSRDTVRQIPAMYETLDDAWLRERLPDEFFRKVLGMALWQWLGMVLLVAAALLTGFIIPRALRRQLQRLAGQYGLELQLPAMNRLISPTGQFVGFLLLYYGVPLIVLPGRVELALRFTLKMLTVLAGARSVYRSVDLLEIQLDKAARLTPTRLDDQAVPLIAKLIRTVVILGMLIIFLYQLEVDVASLLAGLGIGGLAVALAAKDTLANLFGSMNLFIDRPFQIGDFVIAGTTQGKVEEVGFRTTRLRTLDNTLITIPNGDLATRAIENQSARSRVRVSSTLKVSYRNPPDRIEDFVQKARALLASNPMLITDDSQVFVTALGADSVDVTVLFFVQSTEFAVFAAERQRVLLEVLRLASSLQLSLVIPAET